MPKLLPVPLEGSSQPWAAAGIAGQTLLGSLGWVCEAGGAQSSSHAVAEHEKVLKVCRKITVF